MGITVKREQENVLTAQLDTTVSLVVQSLHLVTKGITVQQRKKNARFALQVTAVSWLTHLQFSVQLGATRRRDN